MSSDELDTAHSVTVDLLLRLISRHELEADRKSIMGEEMFAWS